MRWWWSPSPSSDDEIVQCVHDMVAAAKIRPELAQMYERVLRDVADGEAVNMNDLSRSIPRPKFPKPSD